jgi:hypothetical protein
VRGVFIRPYVAIVSRYFRWAKLPLSQLANLLRPWRPWKPLDVGTLDEYAAWMKDHLRWRPDPLAGMLDIFPSLGHMAWQLERNGTAADDCDGLAYFSAAVVGQFADRPDGVYVVSMVLDPRHLPVVMAAHVICVFHAGGAWRVISNSELFPRSYPTFDEAVRDNPYARGHEIMHLEVRDARLRRVQAPGD